MGLILDSVALSVLFFLYEDYVMLIPILDVHVLYSLHVLIGLN